MPVPPFLLKRWGGGSLQFNRHYYKECSIGNETPHQRRGSSG
jgi:hypothetical protein